MVKVPANGFLLKALFLACRWQLLTMTSLGLSLVHGYREGERGRWREREGDVVGVLSASLLIRTLIISPPPRPCDLT